MRVYIFFLIIFLFGLIGFEIKKRYIDQKNTLLFLKSFIEYIKMNISLYRLNIQEIINNYIIIQNNKNAKYVNLFPKNNNFNAINMKNIKNNILNKDLKLLIETYFFNLGKEDSCGEIKKAEQILMILDKMISKTNEEVKLKGDLYFKILLSIGIVMVIVLW